MRGGYLSGFVGGRIGRGVGGIEWRCVEGQGGLRDRQAADG